MSLRDKHTHTHISVYSQETTHGCTLVGQLASFLGLLVPLFLVTNINSFWDPPHSESKGKTKAQQRHNKSKTKAKQRRAKQNSAKAKRSEGRTKAEGRQSEGERKRWPKMQAQDSPRHTSPTILCHVGAILAPSWDIFEPSWAMFGLCWSKSGAILET